MIFLLFFVSFFFDFWHVLSALFGCKGKGQFGLGIFGELCAYFAVVENQMRGSLHIHIVLWLLGVTPDAVRTYVQDPAQERRLVTFLESIVTEQLPQALTGIRSEPAACYRCPDPDEPNFEKNFEGYLTDVVLTSNIHKHTATCYKYVKDKQPKICRLDYGRRVYAQTTVDDYTGGILYFLLCVG